MCKPGEHCEVQPRAYVVMPDQVGNLLRTLDEMHAEVCAKGGVDCTICERVQARAEGRAS